MRRPGLRQDGTPWCVRGYARFTTLTSARASSSRTIGWASWAKDTMACLGLVEQAPREHSRRLCGQHPLGGQVQRCVARACVKTAPRGASEAMHNSRRQRQRVNVKGPRGQKLSFPNCPSRFRVSRHRGRRMMRGEGARGRCPFSVQLAYMLARSPFFDSILARSTTVICNFEFPDRKIGVIPSSRSVP